MADPKRREGDEPSEGSCALASGGSVEQGDDRGSKSLNTQETIMGYDAQISETVGDDRRSQEAPLDFDLTSPAGWVALRSAWQKAWALENQGGPQDAEDHGSTELEDLALLAPSIDRAALAFKLELIRETASGTVLDSDVWDALEADIRRFAGVAAQTEACPVEAIAGQLYELSLAHDLTDREQAAHSKDRDAPDRWRWEAAGACLWDRHHALREVAMTLPARSANGALVQLGLINQAADGLVGAFDWLADTVDYGALTDAGKKRYDELGLEKERAERQLTVCLYSVRRWLQASHDVSWMAQEVASGAMNVHSDPLVLMTTALSRTGEEVAARAREAH
jgi:hypothetical protein